MNLPVGGPAPAARRPGELLKTLYGYLMRDLLRVTLLTLVALTLLMTVLAILQPLRKWGLAGTQALLLFVYTLPVVLSFTLPVATLFAATLVYGRFSQDNELLASRASGVSTLSLIKPALFLGAGVTVISLTLSNFVAPNLNTLAGLVKSNVREFIYQPLKRKGYIELSRENTKHIIHADVVDAENDTLHGVVYAYIRKPRQAKGPNERPRPGGVFLASAAGAHLGFLQDANGNARLLIEPVSPSIIRVGETVGPPETPEAERLRIVIPLDREVDEKPSWYSWEDLLRTLKDPSRHGEIRRRLGQIKQWISSDVLADNLIVALRDGGGYRGLQKGDETYEVRAEAGSKDDQGSAVLSARKPDGTEGEPVTVTVSRQGKVTERITAPDGRVSITWSPITRKPQVTIKLTGDVTVTHEGPSGRRQHRETQWARGEIAVPPDVRQRADQIELIDLYEDPARYTRSKRIIASIDYLKKKRISRLEGALIAEMHARVAYGLSCFLMVAMGAALGTIFRGGQFISAFVISAVPASLVIALLLMGKGMVQNPDVEAAYGLACIWGGIVALLIANVLIFLHLARK